MPILKIFKDTRGRGTCRSCGAAIEWAELITGRRMPFDWPIVVVRTQGNLLDGDRVVEDVDTSISFSHFATCPDAKAWRKGR